MALSRTGLGYPFPFPGWELSRVHGGLASVHHGACESAYIYTERRVVSVGICEGGGIYSVW